MLLRQPGSLPWRWKGIFRDSRDVTLNKGARVRLRNLCKRFFNVQYSGKKITFRPCTV